MNKFIPVPYIPLTIFLCVLSRHNPAADSGRRQVDKISAKCYHFSKNVIIGGIMVRTQIQLTKEQARAVKTVSKAQGISTAEVIRRAIDLLLRSGVCVEEGEKRMRALNIVGRFRSGRHDISKNHDAHLADAYSK